MGGAEAMSDPTPQLPPYRPDPEGGRRTRHEESGTASAGHALWVRALLRQGLSDGEIACLAGTDARRVRALRQYYRYDETSIGRISIRTACREYPEMKKSQTSSKKSYATGSYPPVNPFSMLNGTMPVPLKSVEQIGKTMMDAQNELMGFLGRRLESNTRAWQSFSACSNWGELMAAQQDWLEAARNDYVDETSRMTQINRRILESVAEVSANVAQAGQISAEQASAGQSSGNGRSGDGKSG
jgi:hypothetical protein